MPWGRMFRLLKLAVTVIVVLIVALCVAAWLGLEGAARKAAATAAKPWEKRLTWERVSTRLLPPSAVLEGALLVNAEGDELLRARRIALPLLPGAWTGRGAATASPRLEGFTITLDVPRDDAPNWVEAMTDTGLRKPEWWSGSDGAIVVRFGGADGEAIRFDDITIKRRKYSLHAKGRVTGVPGSSATLAGEWDPAGKAPISVSIAAEPFDASPWTAWILSPGEGRVRGGRAFLDGRVTFPASSLAFEGTLGVTDLLIEGADARPGSVETAIRRGNGNVSFPIAVRGPLGAAADWRTRVRDAVRDAEPRR
jgi:hypothetical protein